VSTSADSFLQRVWYDRELAWLSSLLLPLSWLFHLIVEARRFAYAAGLLRAVRVTRKVIVVGNISVGGTGKTPFTIWLATQLQARGVRAGIILRGYGGDSSHWPRVIDRNTDVQEVGDEAVLLANRTDAIVVAAPDRVAAARRAIELGAEIVLSDDGLQHYRLERDCEIAVVDGSRGVGNGRLLPAGPLREPPSRLAEVDLRVISQPSGAPRSLPATISTIHICPRLTEAISLTSGEVRPLASFRGAPLHAVAGIGHPQRFFDALRACGLEVAGRALPDHARLAAADIVFADSLPVLMTEKDAVKCRAIADPRHWAVRMDVMVSEQDAASVTALLDRLLKG
jgi:tetraacyldisaccharide 4'-kinase